MNDEIHCDYGTCKADPDARGITNCVYCGKELHEKDGAWWTWDADEHENPKPQDYVTRPTNTEMKQLNNIVLDHRSITPETRAALVAKLRRAADMIEENHTPEFFRAAMENMHHDLCADDFIETLQITLSR